MRPYSVLVSGCILICTLSSAEQNASLKKATTMTAKKSNSIAPSPIALKWLDRTAPVSASGISWGIPWPRGQVAKETSFALSDPAGHSLPVQSWPLAYWPDGSLKWTGHAFSAESEISGNLQLSTGTGPAPTTPISVEETEEFIEIDTGPLQCRIAKQGAFFIDTIRIGDRVVAQDGKLIAILEDRSAYDDQGIIREEIFVSRIQSVAVEQSGPVRAVVKIEGMHQSESSERSWLPFTLRLYLYADLESVRLVHTFIYDGEAEQDFIKGLGLSFAVPLREEFHNRHISFAGEDEGAWHEPVRPLTGRRSFSSDEHPDMFADQLAGKRLPGLQQMHRRQRRLAEDLPVWDGFKLVQNAPDYFSVEKRTGTHSAWIAAGHGRRSQGLAYIGDASGGLAVAMRNFWQLHPTTLEVSGASTETAELKIWLWSPEASPMDTRHYDIKAHGLSATYEDVQEGFSTPHGIARTTELTLWGFATVPSQTDLVHKAQVSQQHPLLVCDPAYYHSIPVFGTWSIPDRSTPAKRWIENELDERLSFYQLEIEQRHWYGFWDFGDIMHTYDSDRHTWRYDIGGFAWHNSELAPDIWLWYSFLRSGRADIFRMAEAMTRHTGEVDVYHLGRFAGLGSRHNVRHWGCGSKEARISQATLRRFYYYLSTDERTGDLMREVADADLTLLELDPMRLAMPLSEHPSQQPARARIGPDWLAFAGNWMTEWERTGDTRYRDKIVRGMDSIAKMPHGLFSGPGVLGYDPQSNMLYNEGAPNSKHTSHLVMIMGGAEVGLELIELIDHTGWNEAWMQYCEFYAMPADDPARNESNRDIGDGNFAGWHARLTAYAAAVKHDTLLAQRAWQDLLDSRKGERGWTFAPKRVEGSEVLNPIEEIPRLETNGVVQWCLNAIELLELIGDSMPEHNPLWDEFPGEAQ